MGALYLDEEFPPCRKSLGSYETVKELQYSEKVGERIVWRRVLDVIDPSLINNKTFFD